MSTEEPKKDPAKDQEQQPTEQPTETSEGGKAKSAKKNTLDVSTGLTATFGKPVSAPTEVSSLNEQIESQYQLLKQKKFAQSAISSTFGDLLNPKKTKDSDEIESGTKTDEDKASTD